MSSTDRIEMKTVIKLTDDLKYFIMEKIKDSNTLTKKEFEIVNEKISEMRTDINNMGKKINQIPDHTKDLKLSLFNNISNILFKIVISLTTAWIVYLLFTRVVNGR